MKRLTVLLAGFAICLIGIARAELPDAIAQQPLFTSGVVKHNILFALDDSGSMDFTVLLPTNDGAVWWDGDRQSFGDPANPDTRFLNFDASSSGVSEEKKIHILRFWRNGSDDQGIPPIRNYGFLRSSEYNLAYYDPNVDYTPWASYGGYNFEDADPTEACYDPFNTSDVDVNPITCDSGDSVDLTSTQYFTYYVETGMACDGDCAAGDKSGQSLPEDATDIWVEHFSEGIGDGDTADDGETAWSSSKPSSGTVEVSSNRFRFSDTGDATQYGQWISEEIDISSATSAGFSLGIASDIASEFEDADQIEVFYKVDGGSFVSVGAMTDAQNRNVVKDDISGNTLQIMVRANTTASNESYYIDDIRIADTSTATPGASCDNSCNTGNDETVSFWVPTYYIPAETGTFDIEAPDVPDVGGGGGVLPPDATEIWVEHFSEGIGDGDTADDGETAWSSSKPSSGTVEVSSNRFRFSDTGDATQYGQWISEEIDISSATSAGFSLGIASDIASEFEDADQIEVFYKVDGGSFVSVGAMTDAQNRNVVKDDISGNTLQIMVRANTTASNESYYIDDIQVSDTTDSAESSYCSLSAGIYTCDCASHAASDDMSPDLYAAWESNPPAFSNFTGGLSFEDFAIGPDGQCLERIEIEASRDSYPSGRDYAGEIQNFANWFEYYRKRHQSMRGGLGKALQNIGGVNTGLFWINNQRTVRFDSSAPSSSEMWDWDDDKARDPSYFLQDHYGHISDGGTPLRSALNHAGSQYSRDTNNPPITEKCQQNFTILFTDGFNSEGSVSGVGNEDSGEGQPYEDNASETLADVAMKYYLADNDNNLRPDLPHSAVPIDSQCPIPSDDLPDQTDCIDDLHMNTYTIGLGAKGEIYNVTHFDVQDAYNNPPSWSNPGSTRNPKQIDDLYHAAINGRGQMYNADTPEEIADALNDAITNIAGIIGSSSAASFNTGKLEAGAMLYQSLLNSNNWSGSLRAFELDPTNGDLKDGDLSEPGLNPDWDAADELDTRDLSVDTRTILTHDGSSGIAFQWSNLTSSQQSDLNTDSSGATDSNGSARLDFIRGDRSNEGTGLNFRSRASRMGDIAHSQAKFVGKPEDPWPDGGQFPSGSDAYSAFKSSQSTRQSVVYVGGNDGMLHGFWADLTINNANAGKEVLAYIPSILFSDSTQEGLHYLTETDYNHRFYVDLSPTVTDVFIDPGSGDSWRSVLVGGLRNGGRGMFALDVTDPTTFSEANAADLVLWEFDSSDDADLGYTFSQAVIVKLNNDKWGAIFGNGYNDSGSGTAQLFILFIEAGVDGTWTSSDYVKLDTGVGSSGDRNGLSRPAVADLDGDFVADRVYAGDLEGNLWAFDISSDDDADWDSAYLDGTIPQPLLKADTSGRGDTPNSGMPQPITSAPALALNTQQAASGNEPNLLVMFGTGQYVVPSDNNTACPDGSTGPCAQSFYVVWDRGEGDTADDTRYNLTYDDLVRQEVSNVTAQVTDPDDDQATIEVESRIVTSSNQVTSTDYGCYLDLPTQKERIVSKPVVRGPSVFFNTIIPEQGACTGGGDGWLMSMDYTDCGANDDSQFDVNKDGSVDPGDMDSNDNVIVGRKITTGMPSGVSILGEYRYTTTTNSENVEKDKIAPLPGGAGRTGRLSWEELRR